MRGRGAVCEAAGTAASTTSGVVLAASVPAGQPVVFAECDPSGGDLAAWAELSRDAGVVDGGRCW